MTSFKEYVGTPLEIGVSALRHRTEYFGAKGALEVFWRECGNYVREAVKNKDHEWVMYWVSMLYSAMTFSAKKGGWNYVRMVWLLYRANSIVDAIKGEDSYSFYMRISTGECHVLLSLYGRTLEVLHRSRFRHILKNEWARFTHSFDSVFQVIEKKVGYNKAHDSYLASVGFALELHRKGVKHLLYAKTAENEVSDFCEVNKNNKDKAQLVARMYRYLGMETEALEVSKRFDLPDQIFKAGGK